MTGYLMEDAREAKRLADKVDAKAWVTKYLTPRIGAAQTVLDVGCGPGHLALSTSLLYPSVSVTGVDLSSDRLAVSDRAFPANLHLQTGNASSLPFSDASFDLTYCRFLLEYLPAREQAVQEMVRVCRPGGQVLLQDLDGQLLWHYPEDEELSKQLCRIVCGLSATGFDPFAGRKLFSMARRSGLEDLVVTAESYHLYAGRIEERELRLWEIKLDIAMPAIAKIVGSDGQARSLVDRFLAYLLRDDSLTYSVVFTVVGTKAARCDLPDAACPV